MTSDLLTNQELTKAASSAEALSQWCIRFDQALEKELSEGIHDTLAQFVDRLNNLGHHLRRFSGPLNDPYGYADYGASERAGKVRLWFTVNVVVTNHLLRSEKWD